MLSPVATFLQSTMSSTQVGPVISLETCANEGNSAPKPALWALSQCQVLTILPPSLILAGECYGSSLKPDNLIWYKTYWEFLSIIEKRSQLIDIWLPKVFKGVIFKKVVINHNDYPLWCWLEIARSHKENLTIGFGSKNLFEIYENMEKVALALFWGPRVIKL